MTSINFNASASTALRTLQQTNSDLSTTQKHVATGLKIGEAKDNAAYWAISTTLKSDNKSLATVKDALNLGAATVDTAYQGLNKAKDVLDEIKSKLTAATQDGVDRSVIQSEISALQDQLKSIATSSTFSGENWLSVDSSVQGFNSNKSIVASFERDSSNAVTIGTVDVNIANVKLYDSSATSSGILDGAKALIANGVELTYGGTAASGATPATQSLGATTTTTGLATAGPGAAIASLGTIDRSALHVNDRITFNLALNGAVATPVTVQVDAASLAAGAGGDTALIGQINAGLTAAGVTGVTASNVGGVYTLTSTATGLGASLAVTSVAALDGDGAAIVQATATGGLDNSLVLAHGTSTTATVTATFAAGDSAAAGAKDFMEFDFQYGNEVFHGKITGAALTGVTDGATLATALQAAIAASKRVGDDVAFNTVHNTATDGVSVSVDPDAPTSGDVLIRTLGAGNDAKVGFSNVHSFVVDDTSGSDVIGAADAKDYSLGLAAAYAAGTDTAATATAATTFTAGSTTIAAGDRITFDATYSDATGATTTESISVDTTNIADLATYKTALQSALDTKFGTGAIIVGDDGADKVKFTTAQTGAKTAFSLSNVLAVDGDGSTASKAGLTATATTVTGTAATTATAASTITNVAYSGTTTYDDQDNLKLDVTIDGTTTKLTVNKATIDAALGTTDGVISTATQFVSVLNKALSNAGIGADATFSVGTGVDAGKIKLTSSTVGLGDISVSNAVASTGASTISVDTIDLTSDAFTTLSSTQKKAALSAYLDVVNSALNSITTSAANLGAVSSRIDLQNTFVNTLMDTIDKGVSNLVDADLTEESTKLQALQTKQQLGIQALSVANSSQQNILRLFQ